MVAHGCCKYWPKIFLKFLMLGNHTTAPPANQFHVIIWGGGYYFFLRVKKFISDGLVPPPSSTLNITFPETNIAPENGWLECYSFLLGPGLFSGGELLVSSFREGILRWFPLKSHSASIRICPGICPRSSRVFARHGGDVNAAVNDVVEKLLKVPERVERVIPQKWHLQSYFYECGILIFIEWNPIQTNSKHVRIMVPVNQPHMFFPCQNFVEFLLTSFEEAAPTATWTLTNGALLKSLSVAIAMAASMVTLGARATNRCASHSQMLN